MRQQYARRTQVLTSVMGFIALAIIVQMTRIQNSPEAAIFRQQASNYAYVLRTFYPDRGEIYDRNGHLLAGNKSVYEIGVDLNIVKDPACHCHRCERGTWHGLFHKYWMPFKTRLRDFRMW